jgi:hypothetical protein
MDYRERWHNAEEFLQMLMDGLRHQTWYSMPVIVSQDSDGKTASLQPTIKGQILQSDGTYKYENLPLINNVQVHHQGGGGGTKGNAGISITHPVKQGDEGIVVFMSRTLDAWFQSGGTQKAIDWRTHHLSDAIFIPQVRSQPRALQQVSTGSSQLRSDDKKNVVDHHPTNGTHIKSVDPSTQAASSSFDPFSMAKKFFEFIHHPTSGHALNATNNGVTHSISQTFEQIQHSFANGQTTHTLSSAGHSIVSAIAHMFQAPNASLDKNGNLHAAQNISAGQNVSASQAISAATGVIGGLSMGGGGASGSGSLAMSGDVSGATLQCTTGYTVATLPTPASDMAGMRAYVTDAASPTFLEALVGGGSKICPAFCDGSQWVAA